MLLKVTKDSANGFIPSLKTDGEYWQAPRALKKGESLEVKDFIGHGLMAFYKDAFEVLQEDPIKDGIDNTIRIEDVSEKAAADKKKRLPSSKKEGAAGDIARKVMGESLIAKQVAVNATAAEYSENAAMKIEQELATPEVDMDIVAKQKPVSTGDADLEAKAKDLVQAVQAKAQASSKQAEAKK